MRRRGSAATARDARPSGSQRGRRASPQLSGNPATNDARSVIPPPPARTVARMSRLALVLLLLLAAAISASAAAADWRAPVAGAIAGRFTYNRSHPYAGAQRRGIDLRTRRGQSVAAPCSGPVRFAGRVPARGGAISVRCGRLVATVLGLSHLGVRRGNLVRAGAPVGRAQGARVRLGARRAGDRHGYVDPLRLLGRPGLGPAPPVALHRPPPLRAPRSRPPAPPRATAPVRAPVPAWVGAALVACGLGAGVRRQVASRRPCPSTSPRPSST